MKIAFTASHNDYANQALREFTALYGQTDIDSADVVVALGGDGHVLRTLHELMDKKKPLFAIRRTASVGFLCNDYEIKDLPERLESAQKVILHPLHLTAETVEGRRKEAWSINEVTVIRETPQSARLSLSIDGIERIKKFSGDGLLVATPAGSTAYNYSCGGPIMPLDANTLVVTGICGYMPRRWSHAVLPQDSKIDIEVLETAKRPVRIEAGGLVMHHAAKATVYRDHKKTLTLLFDPDQHLGERIIREQFML